MVDYVYQQYSPIPLRSIRDLRQVSGVRFQQLISTRCVGVANEMDFLSPVMAFSYNQTSVQVSGFGIY